MDLCIVCFGLSTALIDINQNIEYETNLQCTSHWNRMWHYRCRYSGNVEQSTGVVLSCLTLTCSLIFMLQFIVCWHGMILKYSKGTQIISLPFKRHNLLFVGPSSPAQWEREGKRERAAELGQTREWRDGAALARTIEQRIIIYNLFFSF